MYYLVFFSFSVKVLWKLRQYLATQCFKINTCNSPIFMANICLPGKEYPNLLSVATIYCAKWPLLETPYPCPLCIHRTIKISVWILIEMGCGEKNILIFGIWSKVIWCIIPISVSPLLITSEIPKVGHLKNCCVFCYYLNSPQQRDFGLSVWGKLILVFIVLFKFSCSIFARTQEL